MILLKAPHFPQKFRFHLAFQRQDRSAFNLKHQFSRSEDKIKRRTQGDKGIGIVDGYNSLRPMIEKLVEWLKRYNDLVIASHNPELAAKWVSNLTIASRYMDIPIVIRSEKFMNTDVHLIKLS
jgi:uridine kinase